MRDLRPGDVVHCQGIVCTIKEIVWQEPWEWREAYYLEFLDTNGVYIGRGNRIMMAAMRIW